MVLHTDILISLTFCVRSIFLIVLRSENVPTLCLLCTNIMENIMAQKNRFDLPGTFFIRLISTEISFKFVDSDLAERRLY